MHRRTQGNTRSHDGRQGLRHTGRRFNNLRPDRQHDSGRSQRSCIRRMSSGAAIANHPQSHSNGGALTPHADRHTHACSRASDSHVAGGHNQRAARCDPGRARRRPAAHRRRPRPCGWRFRRGFRGYRGTLAVGGGSRRASSAAVTRLRRSPLSPRRRCQASGTEDSALSLIAGAEAFRHSRMRKRESAPSRQPLRPELRARWEDEGRSVDQQFRRVEAAGVVEAFGLLPGAPGLVISD